MGGTKAVGVGVLFVGYTVSYYGLSQLFGGNWGLFDLLLPSRWQNAKDIPRDKGAASTDSATATSVKKSSATAAKGVLCTYTGLFCPKGL